MHQQLKGLMCKRGDFFFEREFGHTFPVILVLLYNLIEVWFQAYGGGGGRALPCERRDARVLIT